MSTTYKIFFIVSAIACGISVYVYINRPATRAPGTAEPRAVTSAELTGRDWLAPARSFPAPEAGMLIGTVYGIDGGPAPGIAVRVLSQQTDRAQPPAPATERRAFTDDQGYFELTQIPFGFHAVWLYGADAAARAAVTIHPERPVTTAEFHLNEAIDIRGRVLGADAQPIANAEVGLADLPTSEIAVALGPAFRVLTADDGTFSLSQIPAGAHTLFAQAEGYAQTIMRHDPAQSETTITLTPGLSFAGTIHTNDQPLAETAVVLSAAQASTPLHRSTTTAADGTFQFQNLTPGQYHLAIASPDFVLASEDSAITLSDSTPSPTIMARPAARVAGRVSAGPNNKPIAGVIVGVQPSAARNFSLRTATTDITGRYEIAGLRPGEYTAALLNAPGYPLPDPTSLSLNAEGENRSLNFPLDLAARVTGKIVTASGEPVAGAAMLASVALDGTPASAADGTFVVSFSPSDAPFILSARKRTLIAMTQEAIRLNSTGEITDVSIAMREGASLSGEARDESGKPLRAGTVLVENDRYPAAPGYSPIELAIVNGAFQSGLLYPAAYTLGIAGLPSTRIELTLTPGEHRTGILLDASAMPRTTAPIGEMPPGENLIVGRVLGPDDAPLENIVVAATPVDRGTLVTVATGPGGHFELNVTPDDQYNVMTQAERYTNVMVEYVLSGTAALELKLAKPAVVTGRVQFSDPGPVVDTFEVTTFDTEPRNMNWQYVATWTSVRNDGGDFTLPFVQANKPVYLGARAVGYAAAAVSVGTLAPAETSNPITVVLTPAGIVKGIVVDQVGNPIDSANIGVTSEAGTSSSLAKTNADGAFTLYGLETGSVIVSADHQNYERVELEVTVAPGKVAEVSITLGAGGVLEGLVARGDEPIPNAVILVRDTTDRTQTLTTRTGDNGVYTLSGLSSGEKEVTLHLPQDVSSRRRNMSQLALVEEDQITTVDFVVPAEAAALEGYVTIGGQPPERGQVTLRVATEFGDEQMAARLDEEGYYKIEDLSPGPANATAFAAEPNGQLRRTTVAITIEAGVTLRQDFDFAAVGTLHGTLRGLPEGQRGVLAVLPGEIRVTNPTPQEIADLRNTAIAQTQTNQDGTFTVERLEPGPYTIIAAPNDPDTLAIKAYYLFAYFDVPAGGEYTIDLEL